MISRGEVQETNNMISEANLDVRTITMGINLLDCVDSDQKKVKRKKFTIRLLRVLKSLFPQVMKLARNLVFLL